jgi:uncharacterized protein (UPF0332 family)
MDETRQKMLEVLQEKIYELRDLRTKDDARIQIEVVTDQVRYYIQFAEAVLDERIEIRQWEIQNN